MLLDAIFGPEQFFSEVAWKRWSAHGDAKRFGAVHDVLLFYGKTQQATFNKQYTPHDDDYVRERFNSLMLTVGDGRSRTLSAQTRCREKGQ